MIQAKTSRSEYQTMQDKELVALFKEGSEKAFEELYVRYKKNLTQFCKRSLRDKSRAEDIVHDVFLQVFETYDGLNPDLSFFGYLIKIAQNRILDDVKKSNVHLRYMQNTIMRETEATNQTEDTIMNNDYGQFLKKIIDGLSPQQKEVFRLSRNQKLTYTEIAELMQISPHTVQFHASQALKKIKKQFTKHAGLHFKTVIFFLMFFS